MAWAEAGGAGDLGAIVALLVSWDEGEFWFLDDVAMPEGVTPLAIDIEPLVAAAQARAMEEQRLLKLFPDEQIAFRVINQPKGDVSLRPEEFQILFQIGSGRSLAQLRLDSNRPPVELYAIVARLQAAKLIEVIADPESTQRTTKIASLSAPLPVAAIAPIGTLTSDSGTMHPLLEEVTTIGRTAANVIALSDGSISSTHACVVRTAEGFVIEDLGSRNGTFVNSEKITGKRLLADGDVVRLGKVLLTFNLAVETIRKDTTQPHSKK